MTNAARNVVSNAVIATEAVVFAALPAAALLLALVFAPAPERPDTEPEDAADGQTQGEVNPGSG